MKLEYLMMEHEQYQGCVELKLGFAVNQKTFYLPQWEVAQFCLDAIVDECARIQLENFPESRIDDEGRFFTRRKYGNNHIKDIIPEAVPIPIILEQLRKKEYAIPDNYWKQPRNRERIKNLRSKAES